MTPQRQLARLLVLVLLLAAAVLITLLVGLPSRTDLRTAFADHGWWAGIGFAGLYAAVTLTPLPKAVFSLAAGALFGVAGGLAVVLIGATTGASIAFALGRCLGRDVVARFVKGGSARLDEELARHGLGAVVVARLVPVVPFTAVNYLCGLSRLRFGHYALGTVIGILPATTAYVVIGESGSEPGSWPFWVALAALGALTLFGALLATRRRRRLDALAERRTGPVDASTSDDSTETPS